MMNIRKEVRELITINEKIQSALIQGESLTDDETQLIQICASELLTSISRKLDQDPPSGHVPHCEFSQVESDGHPGDRERHKTH
jgi:hypothetical protein